MDLFDAKCFRTDLGRVLNFVIDSPAAVLAEAKESVRRWRWARILTAFPQLAPSEPDIVATQTGTGPATIRYLDFSAVAAQLIKGKGGKKNLKEWSPTLIPSLFSAVTGGQWSQARLASVRSWTDENRCQLCLDCKGTLLHRHQCVATTPFGGWDPPSGRIKKFLNTLDVRRQELLTTRGLFCLKLSVTPPPPGDTFEWLWGDHEDIPGDARWYIDGSMYDNLGASLERLGFGVVVVSPTGQLLAFGRGVPPSWVSDASGAELWAFAVVISMNPSMPDITTDCLNIIESILRGKGPALSSKSPLARAWKGIFSILEDHGYIEDFKDCLDFCRWMPAHGGRNSIGTALKSNGEPISKVDWRANRLVDLLAKSAAIPHRFDPAVRRSIEDATLGTRFSLCRLGSVTHAANHYKSAETQPSGEVIYITKRDSMAEYQRTVGNKKGVKRKNFTDEPARTTASTSTAAVVPLMREKPLSKKQKLEDREVANQIQFWENWVAGRGNLRPTAPDNAKTRMQALRQRVEERERTEVSNRI